MTVNGSLADVHGRRYAGKRQPFGKSQLDDSPRLRRNLMADKRINLVDGLVVRPVFRVIFIGVEKIQTGTALMNPAVTDMIETAVAHSFQKIAPGEGNSGATVEQRGKHIMDDVARTVIVVQKHHGQPVHLRIMCFEKRLYVIPTGHTSIRHTTTSKLNPRTEDFFEKIIYPTVKVRIYMRNLTIFVPIDSNTIPIKVFFMNFKLSLSAIALFTAMSLSAQEADERYIEVTGTSEIEIVPDKIHYLIEIREYFKEEFDRYSKPEDYRTKIALTEIESNLRKALTTAGIKEDEVRTQEVGDNWRKQGQDFLVSKTFDVTLHDFNQIDRILQNVDTKGINTMYIGDLENKDMLTSQRNVKIEALKAARDKAEYLAEASGNKLGKVLRIVEQDSPGIISFAQSNVISSNAESCDSFRTIKKKYSILVRFEIKD